MSGGGYKHGFRKAFGDKRLEETRGDSKKGGNQFSDSFNSYFSLFSLLLQVVGDEVTQKRCGN